MRKIKVIQIGIGHDHATAILDCMLALPDIFEIAALAVPESEKADFADRIEKYKEKLPLMTVEEAFDTDGLDAVTAETEEVNLTKYALLAAKRGLPVHMDKPGGLDAAEFNELIDTVKANESVFHTGYMYRYNESVAEAVRKAKSGELGEVYSVEAHMDCWHTPEKRQWLSRFPGGMMFYLGCHLIDLILQIMGEPQKIIPMNQSTGIDGVTGEDFGFTLFKYKNGVSFAKTCATELGGFSRRQLVICGSKGTVELRPLEKYEDDGTLYTNVCYTDNEKGTDWMYFSPFLKSAPADRYNNMMSSFAKMVRGEIKNPFGYDYELKLYKILLKSCGINKV